MRVNTGQEFVIGGYTVGGATFDALVFGYYDGGKLIYAARTRNGFTPEPRAELMKKFKPLETKECPFANFAGEGWALGRGAHGRQNGGLPVGQAGAGESIRICRVDRGESPAAQPLRGAAG